MVAATVLGEEFTQPAEGLVSHIRGVGDSAVRQRGGEGGLATPEQDRQKLIPDGVVTLPMGLADQVHETFGGEVLGGTSVTHQGAHLQGWPVERERHVDRGFDVGRAGIAVTIPRAPGQRAYHVSPSVEPLTIRLRCL
jgi:hypothetical protein